ncbi:MAG TPA: SIS domain-containing protein [Candidatus Kapabacteria bacterium]|nr:SIS domain-containing protein [Candidatus Kapabacteria bacterium]
MDHKKFIQESCEESSQTKLAIARDCADDISRAIETIKTAYRAKKKLLFCGNGGSAADAQHLATEMMIRLGHDVKRPALGAISLCTDPSNMTAAGNDIGFENVFARNVEGLGNEGDVLIGISTSGNSKNVILAFEKAKQLKMKTIGFLGTGGGKMKPLCDVAIVVPSSNVQRIQEGHIMIGHIIFETVEQELYSN